MASLASFVTSSRSFLCLVELAAVSRADRVGRVADDLTREAKSLLAVGVGGRELLRGAVCYCVKLVLPVRCGIQGQLLAVSIASTKRRAADSGSSAIVTALMTATQSAPASTTSATLLSVDATDSHERQRRQLASPPDAVETYCGASALADGGRRERRSHCDVVYSHRYRLLDLRVRVVRAANQLVCGEYPARNVHGKVGLPQVNAVRVRTQTQARCRRSRRTARRGRGTALPASRRRRAHPLVRPSCPGAAQDSPLPAAPPPRPPRRDAPAWHPAPR